MHLRLGDGAVHEPVVAAVYEKSIGFADAVLPWAAVEDHLTDPLLSLVLAADGDDPARTAGAVAEIQRQHPSAVVGGPEIIAAVDDANAATQAWVNYMLLGLVIAFAAFAVVNTLMLAIRDRGREYALLQLLGASRLQVRRMMRIEALVLVLLGWGIGVAVAATHPDAVLAVGHRLAATRPPAGSSGLRPAGHGAARLAGDDAAHPRHHAGPASGRDRDQGVMPRS